MVRYQKIAFLIGFLMLNMVLLRNGMAESTTAYRWTDKSGHVHFGDVPQDNSEAIQLPGDLPPAPTGGSSTEDGSDDPNALSMENKENSDPNAEKPHVPYEEVNIVSPAEKATVRDGEGLLDVSVEAKPALQKDDKVVLLLDGKQVGVPQSFGAMKLTNVERGEHTLQARILNSGGSKEIESKKSIFYMQRPIINQNLIHK